MLEKVCRSWNGYLCPGPKANFEITGSSIITFHPNSTRSRGEYQVPSRRVGVWVRAGTKFKFEFGLKGLCFETVGCYKKLQSNICKCQSGFRHNRLQVRVYLVYTRRVVMGWKIYAWKRDMHFHNRRKVPEDNTACALPTPPRDCWCIHSSVIQNGLISWFRFSQMIVPTSIDVRDASVRSILPIFTYVVTTQSIPLMRINYITLSQCSPTNGTWDHTIWVCHPTVSRVESHSFIRAI